ncbi:kinesin-like nuclear fusion protein [Lecanora helva]
MEGNNENSFVSGIRPSSIPTPGKLFEMSASATNARSTVMPPPTNTLKRKTLAERAGETARPIPAPPTSRPGNSFVKATSLAGSARETSLASSTTSSRPSSSASFRNVSNSSYGSSVGPTTRPPSAQAHRPHSAMAYSRIQKPASASGRPVTSLEMHEEEPGVGRASNKRKGRIISSSNPQDSPSRLHAPKVRRCNSSSMNHTTILESEQPRIVSLRDVSISTRLGRLNLNNKSLQSTPNVNFEEPPISPVVQPVPIAELGLLKTPSQIPKLAAPVTLPPASQSPSKSPEKSPKKLPRAPAVFLTRDSNTPVVFDTEARLDEVENMCSQFKEKMDDATTESKSLKEMMGIYKIRITELESIRTQLTSNNNTLQVELDQTKARLTSSSEALDDAKRYQNIRLDDMQRQHRRDLDDIQHSTESEKRRILRDHADQLADVERKLANQMEDERAQHRKELSSLREEGSSTQQEKERELEKQSQAFQVLEEEVRVCKADIEKEESLKRQLQGDIAHLNTTIAGLESSVRRLEGHIAFLESDNKTQSQAFADLEQRMQDALKSAAEANDKLRTEETLRRKLHNQVQELKGNIRVFCRVRPTLDGDASSAKINYPDDGGDSKEVEVMGAEEKSSLGNITTKKHAFAFDRVFGPKSQNQDVFEEISQLVQSALDGYNVCIFCYGQTGSGKTHTMSAHDGMIPLAVNQIYDTATALEEKGWKYSMEGSFVEVYNEVLNDLLGKADEFDKKKHEIKHDTAKGKTTITDITTVQLDSPDKVQSILSKASNNRSVASTKANERSSRSHSVFILKLTGENSVTGEKCEGTLNLVDLAGSERLSHSGATGDRLKETQNINKSLSCLGDVIGALGQGKEGGHIPYRNSKLTYLLQFSLGGNSKTLMFVMISPLQAHLSETLTSLKFATKVHNTHIGTAKKQSKA